MSNFDIMVVLIGIRGALAKWQLGRKERPDPKALNTTGARNKLLEAPTDDPSTTAESSCSKGRSIVVVTNATVTRAWLGKRNYFRL